MFLKENWKILGFKWVLIRNCWFKFLVGRFLCICVCVCAKPRLCNGTDLCGWWRTEFLVSLWDPSSSALSTAVSRRSSMLLSMFSLSWSTTAYAQTHTRKALDQKACILFLDLKKQPTKCLGNNRRRNCVQFSVATETLGVVTPASQSCCGKRPWNVDISVQRKRTAAHAQPSIHPIFSLCKIKLRSVCLCTPQWDNITFLPVIWILLLYLALTVCWPQNILQCISHSCMKRSTICNLNGLCDLACLTW